ncbi:hypothetical protein ABT095_02350 [Kitasatospora sp. NPDC002227]|uniref:hypothetical protein n=1 Tax=Kitasatospora sp. NPDC002227 TaxID=3154773 RepID=UPI00331CA4BF
MQRRTTGEAADPAGQGENGAGGFADPVRELMVRHREVCEQAVDPLEIAAALEDSGLGPPEAARYRHADVFTLAEELYARVPRSPTAQRAAAEPAGWRFGPLGWGRLALGLLPAGPLWWAEPGLAVAAVGGVAVAEPVGRWLDRAARGHLGAAATLAEYRARMRPVLPVAVLLHLALVLAGGFAAMVVTAVLEPPDTGLLREAVTRATPVEWAALAAAALLQLLAVVLRSRPALAAQALALAVAVAGGAGPPALLLGCGAAGALLLPYAWARLGRPGAADHAERSAPRHGP